MKTSGKNLLTWLAIFAVVMVISNLINPGNGVGTKMVFSDFMKQVDGNQVASVDIRGRDLVGKLKDDSQFYTYLPEYPDLVEKLENKGVVINAIPLISKSDKVIAGIIGWLPLLIMVGLWIYFSRGASGGGKGVGGAFGFGKSRAKLLQESKVKITFADVAGIDEAKQELTEIVDFLKDSKKYVKK